MTATYWALVAIAVLFAVNAAIVVALWLASRRDRVYGLSPLELEYDLTLVTGDDPDAALPDALSDAGYGPSYGPCCGHRERGATRSSAARRSRGASS